LEGGFLYAAAAPLSMFGCLGIVKAALGILIASIDWPIHGAQVLRNAGFELQGSAAAMIGMADQSPSDLDFQYSAESQLLSVLTQQDIDNSPMGIAFFYFGWNVLMVVATIPLSALSMLPYVAIIVGQRETFTTWVYPVLRIVGSSSCAVVAQFVLQLRIKQILNQSKWVYVEELSSHRKDSILPSVYRALLAVGISATAVGYVGCFTIVQRSSTRDTLIWVCLEALLALVRVFLWGWNPKLDDGTYLEVQLHCGGRPVHQTTTPLEYNSKIVDDHQPFNSMRDLAFLREMRTRMRLRAQCIQPDFSTQIYYATALSDDKDTLHLLTTIIDRSKNDNSATVVAHSLPAGAVTIYSASVTPSDADGVMKTQLVEVVNSTQCALDPDRFRDICDHSKGLINRFQHPKLNIDHFRMSWAGIIREMWTGGGTTKYSTRAWSRPLPRHM
jgi:hypothetical protein